MTATCKSCNGVGGVGEKECSWCEGTGFDITCQDEIVCPYCGHCNSPDEFNESGEYRCSECDKSFHVEVNYSVDYSSKRVDCLNDESAHKWQHEEWYNEGAPREGKWYYRCRTCSQRKWLDKEPTK